MTAAGPEGLYQAVRAVADRRPDACAIQRTDGGTAGYAELLGLADRIAGGLAERGVRAGDCVAYALRGGIGYVALILATARLGAHYVPLLTGFSEPEAKEALRLTRPVLLVTDPATPADTTAPARRAVPADAPAAVPLDRLASAEPLADDTPAHTGVFRVLWSSGSTGFPKGIAWRQDTFVRERRRWIADTAIRDTDVVFCRHTLDVAHATDLHVFAALLSGARLVLADPDAPPRVLLHQLVRYRATVMSALPRHYEELADAAAPGTDLAGIRRALCGGAYLSPAVTRRARETLGLRIREIYGSTEFGLALGDMADGPPGDGLAPVAGVGVRIAPLPGTGGAPDTGELVLRSDCTSEGYLEQDAANARTFRAPEFWTGDMAHRTADGRYRILGRLTDALATSAGPVLAPVLDEEIEATGAVAEAVSLPLHPGAYRNEVLVAVRPRGSVAEASTAARAVLRRHGLHGRVEPVDAVPRTEVGKVDKPSLRARLGLT
ncbi:class I adenylate-forming enzyme family protein [Kitasatospora sp. NPDC088548]|uniref:class I adenylate-forming enzyme family protein n=1 Tax=Kitasatospora sp. NPDC088548 TaxID=3364075 RepID=UPI003807035C